MRWIWIDTFVEFVSGQRATAIKNVTLAEDYLHDHFPGYPVMPPSLMRIQAKLDKGQSNLSISKQEGIAESSIRYHIEKGTLKKSPK